jgi:fatty acid desaturase
VPCYRLGKLHRRIKDELPYCPNGLRETWKHIAEILEREIIEPGYQFVTELPNCEESKALTRRCEENLR